MDEQFASGVRRLTAGVRIRRGLPTRADAVAFARLLNDHYERKISPEYYSWQFFEPPAAHVCLFAEFRGEVVASYGLWVREFSAMQGLCIGLTVDLVVAQPYRRIGLMARLELEMEELAAGLGCVAVYATPNEAAFYPRVRELGWIDLGGIPVAQNALRPRPFHDHLSVRSVTRFDEQVAVIEREFRRNHPGLILAARTPELLNWRFLDNPRYRYHCFLAHVDAKPFAYLVLKIFQGTQQPVGDIVDVLWTSDSETALNMLLDFARQHFWSLGVEKTVMALHTNTVLDQLARGAGFQETAEPRLLGCRLLRGSSRVPRDPTAWFLTMADSEVF